jgi:hypothetical protein
MANIAYGVGLWRRLAMEEEIERLERTVCRLSLSGLENEPTPG